MTKTIRIGTRSSKLALWQAQKVQELLQEKGQYAELVSVKSEGDLDLVTPLYAMDVQGVFTKTLDAHLLSQKIDIAVHSLKDVPTQLAKGIVQGAVLKRAAVEDIFIPNPSQDWDKDLFAPPQNKAFHLATGSVRRKAQWRNRFPNTRFENLRGNVQTRLKKLSESPWNGIIMAKAGLERVGELPEHYLPLPWMLPAPAQGAIMVVTRQEEYGILDILKELNHQTTALAVKIERDFLKGLMGGCSTPIGAFANIKNEKVHFRGNILSPDGIEKMKIEKKVTIKEAKDLGKLAANELLNHGAEKIVTLIKKYASQ